MLVVRTTTRHSSGDGCWLVRREDRDIYIQFMIQVMLHLSTDYIKCSSDKPYHLRKRPDSTRVSNYETRLSSRLRQAVGKNTKHIALDKKGVPTSLDGEGNNLTILRQLINYVNMLMLTYVFYKYL